MHLCRSHFTVLRHFFTKDKQKKSGKQAEMVGNTPIFRLSTPGCYRSPHPDVRNGYTRMSGMATPGCPELVLLTSQSFEYLCFGGKYSPC